MNVDDGVHKVNNVANIVERKPRGWHQFIQFPKHASANYEYQVV